MHGKGNDNLEADGIAVFVPQVGSPYDVSRRVKMLQCFCRLFVHLDVGQVDVDADEIQRVGVVYLVNGFLEVVFGHVEVALHGVDHADEVGGSVIFVRTLSLEHVSLHSLGFLHGTIEMVEVDVVQYLVFVAFIV